MNQPRNNLQNKPLVIGCGAVAGLCLFVIILLVIGGAGETPTEKAPATLGIGETGRLHATDRGVTVLAVSPEAYDAWIKATTAEDTFGVSHLIETHQVYSVPHDTRVLVIDRAMYRRQVRILEGERAGASGWVPMEWVLPLE